MQTRLAAVLALCLLATPLAAFDIQGHRGARGLMPENTLPAFERALATGASTLELDLGLTRDGVLVVLHDTRLNPDIARGPDGAYVTGEPPAVHALTLPEIKGYDVGRTRLGSRLAGAFPGQAQVDGVRIPTLAEVFALAALIRTPQRGPVAFNIETKLTPQSGDHTPDPDTFAAAVAKAVREAGLASRVTVQSFDWRTLRTLERIAPEIRRACLTSERGPNTVQRGRPGASPWTAGLDVEEFGGSVPRLVQAAGCTAWSPDFRDLTEAALAEAKGLGLAVLPWTVNGAADMERLIAWGVDGIITDYPDQLRRMADERGLAVAPWSH